MLLRIIVVLPPKMIILIIFRFGITKDFELEARGLLLGILGAGVPPGSPNPNPISDKTCHFSHPFTDLASKIHVSSQTWPLKTYKCHHYLD